MVLPLGPFLLTLVITVIVREPLDMWHMDYSKEIAQK